MSLVITKPSFHPVDIMRIAYELSLEIEMRSEIPFQEKAKWYARIFSAQEALLLGVEWTYDPDAGEWWFDSKPKAKRKPEEAKGHTIRIINRQSVCSCLAGQMGNLCWARAAKGMIFRLDKYGTRFTTPNYFEGSEELFDDTDEGHDS